jgi:signal transduction histidine kinase
MKNPLTPLRLAAHGLRRVADRDPVVAEAAAVIAEETARLDELAREFAAIGRPAAGPPSRIDMVELMNSLVRTDVVAPIEASVENRGGTVEVHAHYDTLLRAFRNIVRNAVEAIGAGQAGRIMVTVAGAHRQVAVTIRDTGPGIPAGAETRIFEPDFTGKSSGTGLGLAVVRQVVASCGGSVAARSRPEGGAEFTVRLPTADPSTEERNR